MPSEIVHELKHGPNNPRNSEGAFVTLKSGRILFAWSRYYGESGGDDATADIAAIYSDDGGRTWSQDHEIIVPNEGRCNVMSVSLLRTQDGRIALFYLRKNGPEDCRTYMRVSEDEGDTWGEPKLCIPPPGYFVVNNDRVVQLNSGRLIVPASYHRTMLAPDDEQPGRHDPRGLLLCMLSDDGGRSWREAADWWSLPVRSTAGIQEPGVIERRDGVLYSWMRTSTGRQWQSFSHDGGETWTLPEPSPFISPRSPLSMKRIPSTGDLLAVWNDIRPHPGLPIKQVVNGRANDTSWGRTPLAAAIGRDSGGSWSPAALIETDPEHGYCYVAIHFVDDAVLLAYCCGGGKQSRVLQDLRVRRISLDWLYENTGEETP